MADSPAPHDAETQQVGIGRRGEPPGAAYGFEPGEVVDGKYRIELRLGHGGMGAVYRVRRLALDDQAAMKVILPGKDTPASRARFLREARAAARIRHPNVVQVYDFGDNPARQPYFVMEYFEGETLDRRLRARGRLEWEEAAPIFQALCSALEAGHRAGVLHRDLKPANVFLARGFAGEETVKVLDFGLAQRAEDEQARLTQEGDLLGTIAYMAPELVNSGAGAAGAKSDIYALGAMLYEALGGALPYSGLGVAGLLHAIAKGGHRPLDALVRGLPPAVVDAVDAALSFQPEERPASAAELAARLGLQSDAPRPVSIERSRPRISGRTSVVELLAASAAWPGVEPRFERVDGEEQHAGRLLGAFDDPAARLALLVGEEGSGRRRVLDCAAARAAAAGQVVLRGRFFDYGGSRVPPYDFAVELLEPGGAARARVEELLAGAGGESARWRLFDALAEALHEQAAGRPAHLVLEEIGGAGAEDLELLGFLLRDRRAIRIVASARTSDVAPESRTELAGWLADLGQRGQGYLAIRLRPLDEEGLRRWLRAVFGRLRIRPTDLRRLLRTSSGNRQLLIEILRALIADGRIAHAESGWRCSSLEQVELPESVQAALQRTVNGLDDELREVLQVAAVIGEEFRFETLQRSARVEEQALERLLERAAGQGLLSETEVTPGNDYRFVRAGLQLALYQGLGRPRRRRLHGRVVEALRGLYPAERIREVLCHHLLAMGDWAGCLREGLAAAETALLAWDTERAEELVLRVRRASRELEATGQPVSASDLDRLERVGARLAARLGRTDEALALLQGLALRLTDARPRLEVELLLGTLLVARGSLQEAVETLQRVERAATALGDRTTELEARAARAGALSRLDDQRPAIALLESCLDPAAAPALQIDVLRALAWAWLKLAEFSRAEGLAARLLELARATRDLPGEHAGLSILAAIRGDSGDDRGAIEHYERVLELSRLLAMRRGEAIALANLGECWFGLLELEQALAHFEESLAIFIEIRDRACEGDCRVNVGRTLLAAGHVEAAEAMLERGRRICAETGRLEYEELAGAYLGEIALGRGDHATARERFATALALTGAGSPLNGWRVHAGLARALAATGDRAAARAHLDRAAAGLEQKQQRLAGSMDDSGLQRQLDEVVALLRALDDS